MSYYVLKSIDSLNYALRFRFLICDNTVNINQAVGASKVRQRPLLSKGR